MPNCVSFVASTTAALAHGEKSLTYSKSPSSFDVQGTESTCASDKTVSNVFFKFTYLKGQHETILAEKLISLYAHDQSRHKTADQTKTCQSVHHSNQLSEQVNECVGFNIPLDT